MAQSDFNISENMSITGNLSVTGTIPSVASIAGVKTTMPVVAKGSFYSSNNIIPIYTSPIGYDTGLDSISITNLSGSTVSVKLYLTNKNIENQKFIAINNSGGTGAAVSTDAATWISSTVPSSAGNSIFVNGRHVIVNGQGTIGAYVSTDAITWTLSGTIPVACNYIGYGNGVYLATAAFLSTTSIYYSTDTITWTSKTLPASIQWNSIAYGNGVFMVFPGSGSIAARSTDGITWTATTLSYSTNWTGSAYGNGLFVSVPNGPYNSLITSTNGITWTQNGTLTTAYYQALTYGNGKFITLQYMSTGAAKTSAGYYSTDGISWTLFALPSVQYWTSVTYSNGTFFAIAQNQAAAARSTDGITWTATTLPYSSGAFYAGAGGYEDREIIYKNVSIASNSTINLDVNKYDPIIIPEGYSLIPQSSSTAVNFIMSGEKWSNT